MKCYKHQKYSCISFSKGDAVLYKKKKKKNQEILTNALLNFIEKETTGKKSQCEFSFIQCLQV